MINSRDPALLHPALQRGLIELRHRMADKGYDKVGVSSTYRCNTTQDLMYAQGRTSHGQLITSAKGGQSMHNHHTNAALAFDIFQNISGREWEVQFFITAGQLWTKMGGEWGGSWRSFTDRPHMQFTGGLTLLEIQRGAILPEYAQMPWEAEMRYLTVLNAQKDIQPELRKLIDYGDLRGTGQIDAATGELILNIPESAALAAVIAQRIFENPKRKNNTPQ